MAERILQNEFPRPGQSQADRAPPALDPAFAPIDPRTPAERIAEARRLAAHLHFYAVDPERPAGDWQDFFPPDAASRVLADDGETPPHLGLFGAFLDMLAPAQAALNEIGERHLDFHYRRVLGFAPQPALPERAHLCLEAKKGAAPFAVTPAMVFSGGKDAQGGERRYQPLRETPIGPGRLAGLRSVYRDAGGVHFAPVADSQDGLGQALDPATPGWPAFGHGGLMPAPVGFAFASSLLRLAEGERRIRLDLELAFLAASGLDAATIGAGFAAYLSGAKGWLGPYPVSAGGADGLLQLSVSLGAGEPPVVDCQPALHGAAFATGLPALQLVLRAEAAASYGALAGLRLAGAGLSVSATGCRGLQLENDFGSLNPKKAFLPFGPQPVAGSRFRIGCPEALAKPLASLAVHLAWQGAPADLAGWYANYSRRAAIAGGVRASLAYIDGAGVPTRHEFDLMARRDGVTTLSPTTPAPAAAQPSARGLSYTLFTGGNAFSRWLGSRLFAAQPAVSGSAPPPPAAALPGCVTVALIDDFLHADYRREILAQARSRQAKTLNEPYTPTVQEITLDYSAALPLLDLRGDDATAFAAAADLQFFQVGAFGARREHPFLRRGLDWLADKQPGLLPDYPDEGEFIVGVEQLAAGDSVDLLLQVAEGSADPALAAQPVQWSVLCGNHWRPVAADELALDTTRGLRASGLLGIALSRLTTTDNTWLPAGPVWLKAASRSAGAACRLLGVHLNGLEVVRQWPAAGAPAVETLAPGTIGKLLLPPAGLKTVSQPYASFAGRAAEDAGGLRRRAAERLRHRQRCSTAWDYERLLLAAFPELHRIKCIAHASPDTWSAPGHVLIVAVPDLEQRNRPDLLQPKVDLDTLTRMRELAQAHAAPGVTVHLANPAYQPVRLAFKVRFRAGLPFAYGSRKVQAALRAALSPWAFGGGRQLAFGGRLYRSVLLDFVEELPDVDFVTDFRLGLAGAGDLLLNDVAEIVAGRPDAILVSADRHLIGEATD